MRRWLQQWQGAGDDAANRAAEHAEHVVEMAAATAALERARAARGHVALVREELVEQTGPLRALRGEDGMERRLPVGLLCPVLQRLRSV